LDLITGKAAVQDYTASAVGIAVFILIAITLSIKVFNKKSI